MAWRRQAALTRLTFEGNATAIVECDVPGAINAALIDFDIGALLDRRRSPRSKVMERRPKHINERLAIFSRGI
jgi:hypothetical protein